MANLRWQFAMFPAYNVERSTLAEYPVHKIWKVEMPESLPFNFTWFPRDLEKYYKNHAFLSKPFGDYYGFSLEGFVSFFLALYWLTISSYETSRTATASELLQKAYAHGRSLSVIAEKITATAKRIPCFSGHTLSLEETHKILATFTLAEKSRERINLTTLGPRPLVIHTFDESFLIDFLAAYSILRMATHFVGAVEVEKGRVFEEFVLEVMTEAGCQEWKRGQLRALDGSRREVDYSFITANVLFLCEVKCINLSLAWDIGRKEAIKFRTDKLSDALDECDEKATWLSRRPQGRNYHIPPGVAAIVPVVVSPFPEYMWSTRDHYWLTDAIPRVCVPRELRSFAEPELLRELLRRSFVRYVS